MSNNDYFPHDEIPDSNVFPTMTGRFEWRSLEDGKSSTGKRMFKGQFICIEPAQYAGMPHSEYFVTGTDENPDGIVPGSMGARSLKAAFAAAQLPANPSAAHYCNLINASHPQLGLALVHQVEQGGEYAGREQNRVTAYKKIGDFEVKIAPRPGVMGSGTAPASMPATPAPAAPAPPQSAAPVAPVAQPAAPAAPAAPPAPSAPAAAPVAAPAPTAAPAPATPAPTPAAPQATTAAPAAPAMGIPCLICAQKGNANRVVPMEQFAQHVQRHQNEPGWNGMD